MQRSNGGKNFNLGSEHIYRTIDLFRAKK